MGNKIILTSEDYSGRIDVFINENIEEFSRSFIQKQLAAGNVLLNGKTVNKPSQKINDADTVEITPDLPVIPDIIGENIPLDVVYEDSDLIVVNKPKGMVVHPAAGHYSGTLVNALMYHCGESLSGINGALRPGIVHRIDMDTSGLLVAAKNDNAHRVLSQQFSVHSIKRIYEAITVNVIKADTLDVDKPIGRAQNDRKKMCVTDKNSKKAITHIKVLERFAANTFVEARLETGRTHQIRVHLSFMGYPLVGDTIYSNAKQKIKHGGKTNGQALFAKTLGFIHPSTGEYLEFEAPRPEYFEQILNKLRIKLIGGKI